jgi:lipopolysaccharide export system protein LptC
VTVEADIIRDRRRAFATPGGFHDKLIAFLAKALPAAIGVIAAVMILVPLSPRGEISFLLDRNKVAITQQRVAVDEAMYRGVDNNGRPFRLTAGQAVQATSAEPIVEMDKLVATLDMKEGPASLRAPHGVYNFDSEQVAIEGPVNFVAADGYRMVTSNVTVDLKSRVATGGGGIEGAVPAGTFSAQQIVVDLEARTVALEGNARMRMIPGQLRLPK